MQCSHLSRRSTGKGKIAPAFLYDDLTQNLTTHTPGENGEDGLDEVGRKDARKTKSTNETETQRVNALHGVSPSERCSLHLALCAEETAKSKRERCIARVARKDRLHLFEISRGVWILRPCLFPFAAQYIFSLITNCNIVTQNAVTSRGETRLVSSTLYTNTLYRIMAKIRILARDISA